nr:hypothetical protein [Tanacetum cinerariifolium]
ESDTEYVNNDPFDSKGEKIKESKLLINELDLPRSSDFLPSSECDSFHFEDFPRLTLCRQPTTRTRYLIQDFDPLLYELPFFKEVPGAETLLSFSFENEEKVFKPGILTFKGVHSSLIPELSFENFTGYAVPQDYDASSATPSVGIEEEQAKNFQWGLRRYLETGLGKRESD